MKLTICAAILMMVLSQCQPNRSLNTLPRTHLVDAIAIEVSDTTRGFAYTNKESGFYYGETNSQNKIGWQGWNIMAHEMLDDYRILIEGRVLSKNDVKLARVYPYQITREYTNNVRETVTLLDGVNALVVEVDARMALGARQNSPVEVQPLFTDSGMPDFYEMRLQDGVFLIARRNHLQRTEKEDYPVWIGVYTGEVPSVVQWKNEAAPPFSPASLGHRLLDGKCRIVFAAGDNETETFELARSSWRDAEQRIKQRRDRMENMLQYSYFRTDNEAFDKAMMWAKLSMDALIMNQRQAGKPVKGIFAGLPWFDNYWGRDTFISLPGATLVTGNFEEAREILLSFSSFQEKDPNNKNYGRIPNLVTPTEIIYNTADGTPWFVRQSLEYIRCSGDTMFAREIYPVVKRSIEGTLKYHTDSKNFLTHGDAETWMDAVGPNGPWSPRGDRAVDIQALWYRQLKSGAELARMNNDDKSANGWNEIAVRLKSNFISATGGFADTTNTFLHDHLRPDGSPDNRLRPNQLFALNEDGFIESPDWRAKNLKLVLEKLVYPYGVATLSQDDDSFHPFHHYEPYYVQDAAYHNGIVWTWLAGQAIQGLCNFGQEELAYRLTENMVHQILDRGAVGTLSELADAAARPGEKEPRLSGTFSQAWSLAEFVRSFYQSYLGVAPNATENALYLLPTLPKGLGSTEFAVHFKGGRVNIMYDFQPDKKIIYVAGDFISSSFAIPLGLFVEPNLMVLSKVTLEPNTKLKIAVEKEAAGWTLSAYQNGTIVKVPFEKFVTPPARREIYSGFQLAVPKVRADLPALKGPGYPLLKLEEIKRRNPTAGLVCDIADPENDDKGDGKYVYPKNPNFRDGIFDITHLTVLADNENMYFRLTYRDLSNPGWHPEYGYQLTYTAIAIHQSDEEGSVDVGMNSKYALDRNHAYQRVIYVGGGLQIQDARGRVLAAYMPVPEDVKNPLGDVMTKTISFSVPVRFLGTPDADWKFTVLAGAQDDHGGAGIGEFRSAEANAGEWIGGGKSNSNQPNVYDVILQK